MGFKAGTPVSKVIEDSYRQSDGIVAYAISIFSWVLVIVEVLLRPHLSYVAFWNRVHLYSGGLILFD